MSDRSIRREDPAARFQALCELAQEMALVKDEESIHSVVLDVAQRVLDFFNCAIMLVDEITNELVMVAQSGYPEELHGVRLPMTSDAGISRWVAQHGEPLYVPDVRQDPRYIPGVREARSELAVPIKIRGRTIGVINVESEHFDAFDRDGALLLEGLASQLAVALELNRVRFELERLTYSDPLTGVYNRRYLERILPQESERAERFAHPLGLLMVDLDGFKEVNDRFGHARGDEVLVAFADVLRRTVRRIDIVIRYGGDEFLILLLETDVEGAAGAVHRIREAVESAMAASPAVPEGCSLRLSVGVAVRGPGEDIAARLQEADQAMYADKQARGAVRTPLAEAP